MMIKSLIFGVLCSTGIFAVKGGIGLSYCLLGHRSLRVKTGATLLYMLTYLLVFTAVALGLQRIDLMGQLDAIQSLLQSGMLVHLVIAGLMLGWGILLLKKDGTDRGLSKGWLLLALPCPVCLMVLVFSISVFFSYFPDHLFQVTVWFYLGYMGISLLTLILIGLLHTRADLDPDGALGGAMLLMAAYFLLSATIMPQFGELDQIYRMACYHAPCQQQNGGCTVYLFSLTAAFFLAGYGLTNKHIRSSR